MFPSCPFKSSIWIAEDHCNETVVQHNGKVFFLAFSFAAPEEQSNGKIPSTFFNQEELDAKTGPIAIE